MRQTLTKKWQLSRRQTMEFNEIVRQRYATKQFDGKKIPEEKINELFELIRLAASAVNIQPWKIKVITDQKIKDELLPASFNQQQITTCSHLLVFCANTDIDGNIEKVDKLMKEAGVPDEIRNMMLGIAKGMIGNMPSEKKLAWAREQVFLALGNAVNGAKALGFDSCPMSGFDPTAYSRVLNLPAHLVPTMLCPVGYAADKPMPKMRFPREEIFF
jgi:nitroreductase / dihydropteridine reductase